MSVNTNVQIARRYAQALFDVVPAKERGTVLDEFKQALVVLADPKIHQVFTHPRTSLASKTELIRLMKLTKILENFFFLIVEKSREPFLSAIQKQFEELLLNAEQTSIADIIAAVPLNAETMTSLKKRLEELSGKTVRLNPMIDPTIGGGLIIKIDGKVLDGSVTNSLQRFQRTLTS